MLLLFVYWDSLLPNFVHCAQNIDKAEHQCDSSFSNPVGEGSLSSGFLNEQYNNRLKRSTKIEWQEGKSQTGNIGANGQERENTIINLCKITKANVAAILPLLYTTNKCPRRFSASEVRCCFSFFGVLFWVNVVCIRLRVVTRCLNESENNTNHVTTS